MANEAEPAPTEDEFLEPEWFERETISRALAGDREAALTAIDLAVTSLLAGDISRELASYVGSALEHVHQERDTLSGETFIKAFNLARERKRPSEAIRTQTRDVEVAAWVHLAKARGVELTEAKGLAADAFGIANIDRCLRNAGEVLEVNEAAYERIFLHRGIPLPSRQ